MKTKIEFEMDNAAFEDYPDENNRILTQVGRKLVEMLEAGRTDKRPLLDTNGNIIGKVVLTVDEPERVPITWNAMTELSHGGRKRVEFFKAECGKWSFKIIPTQNGYELYVRLSLGSLGKLCPVQGHSCKTLREVEMFRACVDSLESAKAMAEKFVREEKENV